MANSLQDVVKVGRCLSIDLNELQLIWLKWDWFHEFEIIFIIFLIEFHSIHLIKITIFKSTNKY